MTLDHLGTGHASLGHFQGLSLEETKLARSFVSGFSHRHRDLAIRQAAIDLAAGLDLRVVAEGVELGPAGGVVVQARLPVV